MYDDDTGPRLPAEVVEKLLLFLSPNDLASCLGVNHIFRGTCNSDMIWSRAIGIYLPMLMRIIVKEDWINLLSKNISDFSYPKAELGNPSAYLKCYMKHMECIRNQYNGKFSISIHNLTHNYDYDYNYNGILFTTTQGDRVKFYDMRHDMEHIHTICVDPDSCINDTMFKLDMFVIHYSDPVFMGSSIIEAYDILYTAHGVEFRSRYKTSLNSNDSGYMDANKQVIIYHAYGLRKFHVVNLATGQNLDKITLCGIHWSVSDVMGQVTITADNCVICPITDGDEREVLGQTFLVCIDITTRKQKFLVNLAKDFQLSWYNRVLSEDNKYVCYYDSRMDENCINTVFIVNLDDGKVTSFRCTAKPVSLTDNFVLCFTPNGFSAYSLTGIQLYSVNSETRQCRHTTYDWYLIAHRDIILSVVRDGVRVYGIKDGKFRYHIPLPQLEGEFANILTLGTVTTYNSSVSDYHIIVKSTSHSGTLCIITF